MITRVSQGHGVAQSASRMLSIKVAFGVHECENLGARATLVESKRVVESLVTLFPCSRVPFSIVECRSWGMAMRRMRLLMQYCRQVNTPSHGARPHVNPQHASLGVSPNGPLVAVIVCPHAPSALRRGWAAIQSAQRRAL